MDEETARREIPEIPTVRTALHILGQVQGVGYRYAARREAERLGLAGFVRNETDGSVYAEAEGSSNSVGAFIRWCRKGPPNAWVETVETQDLPVRRDAGFEILHG